MLGACQNHRWRLGKLQSAFYNAHSCYHSRGRSIYSVQNSGCDGALQQDEPAANAMVEIICRKHPRSYSADCTKRLSARFYECELIDMNIC
jgi:hypothetical protein